MKLRTLELLAFGVYEDRVLRFEHDARLALVYGPNESGKSTALRALHALLFGVPRGSEDAHRFGAKLRVAAELEDAAGERVAVARRKGSKATLLTRDERPLDEALLTRLLQPVDEALFERLFGLNGERLRRAGESIGASDGDLATILFGAASGSPLPEPRLRALEERADAIYRRRAKTAPLVRALAELDEARRSVRETALSSATWAHLESALADARRERVALRDARQARLAEREQLQRVQRCEPRLAERRLLIERVQALRDAPDLAPDASTRRTEAERASSEAERQIGALERALARDRERLAELAPEPELERAGPTMERLARETGAATTLLRDLPKRAAELQSVERELELARRSLPELLRDDPGERATVAAARVRALGGELERRRAEIAQRGEEIEGLAARIARGEAMLAALPEAIDVGALVQAQRACVRDLERAEEHAKAQHAIAAERATITRGVERLLGAGGEPDALERIAVPSRAALESLDARERALFARQSRLDEQRERLTRRRDELARDRAALEAGRPVPTREALAALREARDDTWRTLRGELVERAPGAAAPVDARPLADALEHATERADAAADALVDDADRVARCAELERLDAQRLREETDHTRERTNVESEHEALRAALALAGPSGTIAHGSVAALRAWLEERDRLVARSEALRESEAECRALGERIDAARRVLARALGLENESDAALRPEDLIARAEARVNAAQENESRRERYTTQLDTLRDSAADARSRQEAATSALVPLEAEWAEAVATLGLSASARLAEAESVLDALSRAQSSRDEAEKLRVRIAAMERDLREIAASRDAAIAALAPALEQRPEAERVEALRELVERARERAQERARLEVSIPGQQEELARAMQVRAGAVAVLAALCAQAGATGPEALIALEERAGAKRAARERLAQVERDLVAEGRTPEELEAERAAVDRDALEPRLELVSQELEQLEARLESTIRTERDLEAQREALLARTDAEDAAERAQDARARSESLAEEWTTLRLAARLLRGAIEQHRDHAQRPLLERASALLAQLTDGSFARLEAWVDEGDRTVIRGVRATGEPVLVGAMSEGTRDQLHLALRLAAIDRHVASHGPMPLVLDDVLVHFDDDRARAALRVLADFAARTQVLCFTHHEHLVALARESLPESRLDVQTL